MFDNFLTTLAQLSAEKKRLGSDSQQRLANQTAVRSLTPKPYRGDDAEQGQLQLGDRAGGTANATGQGHLSNSTRRVGDSVSPYDWQTADWMPTRAQDGGNSVQADENQDGYDPNDGSDADGNELPDGTPPLEDSGAYCQVQTAWVRGTDCTLGELPSNCKFTGGQCVGIDYRVSGEETWIDNTGTPRTAAINFILAGPIGYNLIVTPRPEPTLTQYQSQWTNGTTTVNAGRSARVSAQLPSRSQR